MNHNTPIRDAPPGLIVATVLSTLTLSGVLIGVVFWQASMLPPAIGAILRVVLCTIPVVFLAGGLSLGLAIAWRRWGRLASIDAHHQAQLEKARNQIAPLAQHFAYHVAPVATPSPLALPAPIDVIKPLDGALEWIDDQPHALLGGRTKAGKTTLATALLERRLHAGETVFIIDPHSSGWMGLPGAGSISNPGELDRALGAVLAEYLKRMQIREDHKRKTGQELPHDYFGRMTVVIDEANAIYDMLPVQWKTIIKQLASGSRKIGIALLILGQSALVEDLGMTGQMRENLARLALDDRTVQAMVDGERDRARKEALRDALIGRAYPAAASIGAQVWLIDRQYLTPGVAPVNAAQQVWTGWDFARGCAANTTAPQPAPVAVPRTPTTPIAAPVAAPVPLAPMPPTVRISFTPEEHILTLLQSAGRPLTTAEIERAIPEYSPRSIYNKLNALRRGGQIRHEKQRWLI